MKELKRVSRWIRVDFLYVTEKHSLFYYSDKESGEMKYCSTDKNQFRMYYPVSAFRWNNRYYAINQFINRFSAWGFDQKCENYPAYICGYDGDGNLYNPLLLEMDKYGEKVRLYLEV